MTEPTRHLYHFCTLTPHASHANYKSGSIEAHNRAETNEGYEELLSAIADTISQESGSFVLMSLSYLGTHSTTDKAND